MAPQANADVGLIGLAIMGRNLALNIADHGFTVAVYNRTTEVMRDVVAHDRDTPGGLVGCDTLQDLVAALRPPRKILLMVQAGPAVDAVTEQLLDVGLDPDDLVVDCGNSLWTDTIRREADYAGKCKIPSPNGAGCLSPHTSPPGQPPPSGGRRGLGQAAARGRGLRAAAGGWAWSGSVMVPSSRAPQHGPPVLGRVPLARPCPDVIARLQSYDTQWRRGWLLS